MEAVRYQTIGVQKEVVRDRIEQADNSQYQDLDATTRHLVQALLKANITSWGHTRETHGPARLIIGNTVVEFELPEEQLAPDLRIIDELFADEQLERDKVVTSPHNLDLITARYPDREKYLGADTPETTEEFYCRVWGDYHDAGLMFQDILGVLDPRLLNCLKENFTRTGRNLAEWIPRKEDRLDKIISQLNERYEQEELQRLTQAVTKAKRKMSSKAR